MSRCPSRWIKDVEVSSRDTGSMIFRSKAPIPRKRGAKVLVSNPVQFIPAEKRQQKKCQFFAINRLEREIPQFVPFFVQSGVQPAFLDERVFGRGVTGHSRAGGVAGGGECLVAQLRKLGEWRGSAWSGWQGLGGPRAASAGTEAADRDDLREFGSSLRWPVSGQRRINWSTPLAHGEKSFRRKFGFSAPQ